MCPETSRHQLGFSLPVAIFIIVIMAGLGTSMLALNQSGKESLAGDTLSVRAFYAAESGAFLAMQQIFPLDASVTSAAACTAMSLTPAFTTTGLDGCTAAVSCSPSTVSGKIYYHVTSTGHCQLANQQANRTLQVMAASP